MMMRPNDGSNISGILTMLPQDIYDVLLNRELHAGSFDSIEDCLWTVLKVLADTQVEDHGVIFGFGLWVLVFDQESIAAGYQVVFAFDVWCNELVGGHSDHCRGIDDRDFDDVFRVWDVEVWGCQCFRHCCVVVRERLFSGSVSAMNLSMEIETTFPTSAICLERCPRTSRVDQLLSSDCDSTEYRPRIYCL